MNMNRLEARALRANLEGSVQAEDVGAGEAHRAGRRTRGRSGVGTCAGLVAPRDPRSPRSPRLTADRSTMTAMSSTGTSANSSTAVDPTCSIVTLERRAVPVAAAPRPHETAVTSHVATAPPGSTQHDPDTASVCRLGIGPRHTMAGRDRRRNRRVECVVWGDRAESR